MHISVISYTICIPFNGFCVFTILFFSFFFFAKEKSIKIVSYICTVCKIFDFLNVLLLFTKCLQIQLILCPLNLFLLQQKKLKRFFLCVHEIFTEKRSRIFAFCVFTNFQQKKQQQNQCILCFHEISAKKVKAGCRFKCSHYFHEIFEEQFKIQMQWQHNCIRKKFQETNLFSSFQSLIFFFLTFVSNLCQIVVNLK